MALRTASTEVGGTKLTTGRGAHRRRIPGGWIPFVLIAPAVLLELLIHVIPMLVGIWMSFIKLTQFYIANWTAAPFAGLSNYTVSLDFSQAQGQALLTSFLETCVFTVFVVGLSWVFGMAGAVALQRPFRGRGALRTLFLIPYAVPIFAGIIAWKFMFQQQNGLVNAVLVGLHLASASHAPFWLIGSNAIISAIVAALWRTWPFAFLMLMAGMQSINEDLYEAASLDGARGFRQWRSITLPGLGPVNKVLVLVMFLWTFNDFNTPFILFSGSEPASADLFSLHVYNTSFIILNFGMGSAMSVLLLLFLLLVTAIYLLAGKRRSVHA